VRTPPWLTLLVAVFVLTWGGYRIKTALRSHEEEERARAKRKGLFALPRRRHFLYGVIYLILGGMLVATAFGWRPIVLE
jgi:hypothetical protein